MRQCLFAVALALAFQTVCSAQIQLADIKAGYYENFERLYEVPISFQWHVEHRWSDEAKVEVDRLIRELSEAIKKASADRKPGLQQMLKQEQSHKGSYQSGSQNPNLQYQLFYKHPGYRVRFAYAFDNHPERIPFSEKNDLYPPGETRASQTYTRKDISSNEVVISSITHKGIRGFAILDHDLSRIRIPDQFDIAPMVLKIDPDAGVFKTPVRILQDVFTSPESVQSIQLNLEGKIDIHAIFAPGWQNRRQEVVVTIDPEKGYLPSIIKSRYLAFSPEGRPIKKTEEYWSDQSQFIIERLPDREVFYVKSMERNITSIKVHRDRLVSTVFDGVELGNRGCYYTGPVDGETTFVASTTKIDVMHISDWIPESDHPLEASSPDDARFINNQRADHPETSASPATSIDNDAAEKQKMALPPSDSVPQSDPRSWTAWIFLGLAFLSLVVLYLCKRK